MTYGLETKWDYSGRMGRDGKWGSGELKGYEEGGLHRGPHGAHVMYYNKTHR